MSTIISRPMFTLFTLSLIWRVITLFIRVNSNSDTILEKKSMRAISANPVRTLVLMLRTRT